MLEEFHFWRPEKVKFVTRILLTLLVIVFLIFATYGWILYQQKAKESTMHSEPPLPKAPPAASIDANNADATNTSSSSLSPMPPP
jgi:hypothetical protein